MEPQQSTPSQDTPTASPAPVPIESPNLPTASPPTTVPAPELAKATPQSSASLPDPKQAKATRTPRVASGAKVAVAIALALCGALITATVMGFMQK